ncbi:MAG: YIP1 family protein [Rhodobacteraceae bacterium]|nr:MAG: YIP1 family protein [Paracoccaceae bacterium]
MARSVACGGTRQFGDFRAANGGRAFRGDVPATSDAVHHRGDFATWPSTVCGQNQRLACAACVFLGIAQHYPADDGRTGYECLSGRAPGSDCFRVCRGSGLPLHTLRRREGDLASACRTDPAGIDAMDLNVATISALLRVTFTRPQDAAASLLRSNLPDDARWLGFVIVVLLSVILGYGSLALLEGEATFAGSLMGVAIMQTMLLLGMVVAVQGIGRACGGHGTFPDTLLLMAWLQFAMLAFQLGQIAVAVILPQLFGLIVIVSVVAFFWLLVNFISVLHGFSSALKVFVGIIFTLFGLSLIMAVILGMFGVAAMG